MQGPSKVKNYISLVKGSRFCLKLLDRYSRRMSLFTFDDRGSLYLLDVDGRCHLVFILVKIVPCLLRFTRTFSLSGKIAYCNLSFPLSIWVFLACCMRGLQICRNCFKLSYQRRQRILNWREISLLIFMPFHLCNCQTRSSIL